MKNFRLINYKFNYASLYERATSQLFDLSIFLILFLPLFNIIHPIILGILFIILYISYFILFEYKYGQTIGKKIINIKVLQDNGLHPTFKQVFSRNILRFIDFLPALYITGAVFILINDDNKRVGDIYSKTVVISTEKVLDLETEKKVLASLGVTTYNTEQGLKNEI